MFKLTYEQIKETFESKNCKLLTTKNDFYWINLPDKEIFYIIPEKILIKDDQTIISSLSFADKPKNKWLNDYKFLYNEFNINEIIKFYFKI